MTYFGRRKVYLGGLGTLCVLLLIIGVLAIPSQKDNLAGAKWGQAAMVLLWVFTYDFTVGVSRSS